MIFVDSFSTSGAESTGPTFLHPEFKDRACGLSREDSVTCPWADRSGLTAVWTRKYWDHRAVSLGYGDRKWYLKPEWDSET